MGQFFISGKSFINIKKGTGPNTLPCGTPLVTVRHVENVPGTCPQKNHFADHKKSVVRMI